MKKLTTFLPPSIKAIDDTTPQQPAIKKPAVFFADPVLYAPAPTSAMRPPPSNMLTDRQVREKWAKEGKELRERLGEKQGGGGADVG